MCSAQDDIISRFDSKIVHVIFFFIFILTVHFPTQSKNCKALKMEKTGKKKKKLVLRVTVFKRVDLENHWPKWYNLYECG